MRLETARGESLATARLWTKPVAGSRGADELAWGIGTLTLPCIGYIFLTT